MYKGSPSRSGFYRFEPLCSIGDINEDDSVDVLDIVSVVNFVIGLADPQQGDVCASDLNSDLEINIFDIILLVNMVLDG